MPRSSKPRKQHRPRIAGRPVLRDMHRELILPAYVSIETLRTTTDPEAGQGRFLLGGSRHQAAGSRGMSADPSLFSLSRSIIHKCPALVWPQSFLESLGGVANIIPLKGATDAQAAFIVDACNEALEGADDA
jgi:hypothetical protein